MTRILEPYVREHGLGLVYHPRSVVRFEGSEAEPDLMVRQPPGGAAVAWENWPAPVLVVEVISDSTPRRDRVQKRAFYMDAAVREYWVVDAEHRSITAVRPGRDDVVARDRFTWAPDGAAVSLTIKLEEVFRLTD